MVLVIGRFVTGCGGSGLTSLGTITMSDIIPLRDRGYYQGLANIFWIRAAGGAIGGLLADWLGWKYVFILQVPLALSVFFAIYFFLNLPEGSPGLGMEGNVSEKLKRVDFWDHSFGQFTYGVLSAASLGGRNCLFIIYIHWFNNFRICIIDSFCCS